MLGAVPNFRIPLNSIGAELPSG